jgi:hypothetical protein
LQATRVSSLLETLTHRRWQAPSILKVPLS